MSGEEARLRAELAATEAEARAALDEMHRRVEAAEDARINAENLADQRRMRCEELEAEVARWRGDETVANLVALRAAVQRHREAVEREQDEATTRAELFALVPADNVAKPCPACGGRGRRLYDRETEDGCDECEVTGRVPADAPTLTVREPATQAERNLDTASGLLGAALVCLAAERAYRETEGRPWAERIAAKAKADEARATLARMMGGE